MYELYLTYHNPHNELVGYDIFLSEEKIEATDVYGKVVDAPSDAVVCVGSLIETRTDKIVWLEVFIMGGYFG